MNEEQRKYLDEILTRNLVMFPKGYTHTLPFMCLAYHDIEPIILEIIRLGKKEIKHA